MIVGIYFSYVNVVTQLMRSVNCIKVNQDHEEVSPLYIRYNLLQGKRIWAEDTSLQCFKGDHLPTAIGGIIGLGFSAVVILLVIIWLLLNKHRLTSPTFVARYWFIYQPYKHEWYANPWEAEILIRKTIVTAILVYSVQLGPTLQAPLCVGVLILAHAIHNCCQPFREDLQQEFIPEYSGRFLKFLGASKLMPYWIKFNNEVSLNALESFSIAASIFVFFSTIISSLTRSSHGASVFMALITLVFNWLFLTYMIYRLYGGFHGLLNYKLEVLDPLLWQLILMVPVYFPL